MQDYNSHMQESEQAQKAFNTKFQVQVQVQLRHSSSTDCCTEVSSVCTAMCACV